MRPRVPVLVLLIAAGVAAAARADDPTEPRYADKPASWWIGEYLSGDDPRVARDVLRRMGGEAAPWVAARLLVTEKSEERCKLLGLLDDRSELPAAAVAALRPSLTSGNVGEQMAALRVVARAGAKAAELAADVAALLHSNAPSVRSQATRALGSLGAAAVPHVPDLVALLGEADEAAAVECVAALGCIGPPAGAALPPVLEFAAARPPRIEVVRALASMAPDDARVADQIVRAAETGDDGTRQSVRAFLVEDGPAGDAIVAAAARLAGSEDRELRMTAAIALGRAARAGRPVPDALFTLLGDADASVAGHAARSLVEFAAKAHSFAPRVAEVYRVTKHANAMTELMLALRPESGPALFDAALSDDTDRRQAAWHVLIRVGEHGVAADPKQVVRMLFDTRVALNLRTEFLRRVTSLRMLPEDATREVCATVATEGDASLAVAAMHVLANDPTRRGALVAAAARPEPSVRAAAVRAMYGLLEQHEDVRAACVAALGDADADVRAAALQVLQGHQFEIWTLDRATCDAVAPKLVALAHVGFRERMGAIGVLSSFPAADRPPDALLAILEYDDASEQAIALLIRTPRCTPELLKPLLDGTDPVLAARAARVALARGQNPSLVARLKGWIESGDIRLAREATIAAAALPPDAIVELGGALIRAARAGVDGVAWPACSALGRIASREPAAREALLAVADDPKNSAQIGTMSFLPSFGEAGIARLVAFLDHPSRDARRSACIQIFASSRGAPGAYAAAIPALERIAKGDDLELARYAQDALKSIRK